MYSIFISKLNRKDSQKKLQSMSVFLTVVKYSKDSFTIKASVSLLVGTGFHFRPDLQHLGFLRSGKERPIIWIHSRLLCIDMWRVFKVLCSVAFQMSPLNFRLVYWSTACLTTTSSFPTFGAPLSSQHQNRHFY